MSSENRMTALEERIAFQDQTIEDLNSTVLELWKEIDTLKRHVVRLNDQVRQVEADVPLAPEPPPPHY